MKLSTFKNTLKGLEEVRFELPNGQFVDAHFHITEVGQINKSFIDCGGVIRKEQTVNFQLWQAFDYDHRLHPEKLLHIIELSEEKLGLLDAEIEVEYQGDTIGKYGINFNGKHFLLTNKATACLAEDNCGIPEEQLPQQSCCSGSGCC